jgi:hypothetical protein
MMMSSWLARVATPRRSILVPSLYALLGGALLLGGCDDSLSGSCRRDPAEIAARRACQGDEDCPRGAGCTLGQCVAACSANGDCAAGQRCDRFGRCRAADDDGIVAPLSPKEPLLVDVAPSMLQVNATLPRPLSLHVKQGSGEIRATAEAGVALRCGTSGSFAASCSFTQAKAGDRPTLWVQLSAGPLAEPAAVRVFFGDQRAEVSIVTLVDAAEPDKTPLKAGLYSGTISMLAAGVGDAPQAPLQPVSGVALPLTAKVHLGTPGVIVLEDPLRALLPSGKWIAHLVPTTTNTGSVDFPTLPFSAGELTRGAPTEVLLDAAETTYSATSTSLTFELIMSFSGVLIGKRSPRARWRVTLGRSADLPAGEGPPTVPADAQATLATGRGLAATPWEAALAKAATPDAGRVFTLDAAGKRAFLQVYGRGGSEGSLETCNLGDSGANALALVALEDGWGTTPPVGGMQLPATLIGSGRPLVAKLANALFDKAKLSVTSTVTGSGAVRSLPCEASFPATSTTFKGSCGADETTTLTLGSFDLCSKLAASYGCEIVAETGTISVKAQVGYEDGSGCVRNNNAVALTGNVTKVCRLPVVPASCAELALCYDPPASSAAPNDETSVLAPYLDGAAMLTVSGDLKCQAGARSAAITLDQRAELPASDPLHLVAAKALDVCKAEFAALVASPAPTTPEPYAKGLASLLDSSAQCVQAARLLYAIGLATDTDRRRALAPDEARSPVASALANRLIQRWLLHHAFIAREAAEAERLAQVLRGDTTNKLPLPDADAILGASLAGWQLLLHPRFATALDQLPGSVLVSPDYRERLSGSAVAKKPYHEQHRALPVTILETLSAQLALLEPRIELAARLSDQTALAPLGELVRVLMVVRGVAEAQVARAEAHAKAKNLPDPAWLARYRELARESRSQFERIIAQALALKRGDNPLGIRPDDTPLYFFGDEKTATRRFSAISDFIIGSSPADLAWAPTLVSRAAASLDKARAAFAKQRQRVLQAQRDSAAQTAYADKIRQEAGQKLFALCGAPTTLKTNELLEKWTSFDASTCHYRSTDPACKIDLTAYTGLLSVPAAKYQLCLVRELRRLGGGVVGFVDAALDPIADNVTACEPFSYPVACADGQKLCASCSVGAKTHVARLTPASFRQVLGMPTLATTTIEMAQTTCKNVFPDSPTRLPSIDDLPSSPAANPKCFSGSIGEAVYEVRAAATDVAKARSKLDDKKEAYGYAMNNCIITKVAKAEAKPIKAAHRQTMEILRAAKLASDITATIAGGVKDCALSFDLTTAIAFGAKQAVTCATVLVRDGAKVTSASLAFAMTAATAAHNKTLAKISKAAAKATCFNDAQQRLVGVHTASLRISKAMTDLAKAQQRLLDRQAMAQRIYDDGKTALASAAGRVIPALSHELWLDESVSTFLREMRLARRIMYLAVRAVQYETQQSLTLEADVLSARTPAELQTVLDKLWTSAASRGIDGKRPTDLKVVLSLREELLRLADREPTTDTEQALTAKQRFQMMLSAPRYAVFDQAGTYLGQRIPFDLAPIGKLGAQGATVSLLAGTDCAERLWSVNASVIGDQGRLYTGSASPPTFVRVQLLKQNTFYSQWCSSAKEGFQMASVRPAQNLFEDPLVGESVGSGLGVDNKATGYTPARIEAYLNVARADFETDDYKNGETSELAARGLYGRYAIFFPAEVLSIDGGKGLVLGAIDDVLLRLDYVSIAR